ncbi:MAG: protoglobin domain-containing protein [bacterium]
MDTLHKIKLIYSFNDKDVENLKFLKSIMEANAKEFIAGVYSFISNFEDFSKFLPNDEIRNRHQEKLKFWFLNMFSGEYDNDYLRRLKRIGEVHSDIKLPSHYVSATMNYIRNYIHSIILKNFTDDDKKDSLIESTNKIIDINLDIIISSYIDEGKLYISHTKFESRVIKLSSKFSYILDLSLVLTLIFATAMVFFLFFFEIYRFAFSGAAFETTVVDILGAMLIIWAIRELLEEEVKKLQGKKFALSAFIALAMAALLRKVLIFSLAPHKSHEVAILGLLILILGIVYWLMNKKGTDA